MKGRKPNPGKITEELLIPLQKTKNKKAERTGKEKGPLENIWPHYYSLDESLANLANCMIESICDQI